MEQLHAVAICGLAQFGGRVRMLHSVVLIWLVKSLIFRCMRAPMQSKWLHCCSRSIRIPNCFHRCNFILRDFSFLLMSKDVPQPGMTSFPVEGTSSVRRCSVHRPVPLASLRCRAQQLISMSKSRRVPACPHNFLAFFYPNRFNPQRGMGWSWWGKGRWGCYCCCDFRQEFFCPNLWCPLPPRS